MTVWQRGCKTSARWSKVKGLEDVPAECRKEAAAVVGELNRRAGWDRYQLI